MINYDGYTKTDYMVKWGERPDTVDCLNCAGDEGGTINRLNCSECCLTGLDHIPWAELFTKCRELDWREWT